jgi:hypothetical protein
VRTKEKTETGKRLEAGGSLLGVLKGALYGRVVREKDVKTRVRRLLPELHKLVEELFQEVRKVTGKQLLFIVDDLERVTPLDMARELFLDHGGFFGGLPCHLVLTAPGMLRLEDRCENDVLSYFGEARAVMSKPQEVAPTEEMDALRGLVYRRMAPELADPDAVDEAIVKTGGLVIRLIDVLERAIVLALVNEAVALKESDYLALDDLETSGLMVRPKLLYTTAVLEYPDDTNRFAIHPLVKPLLERWRCAHRSKAA